MTVACEKVPVLGVANNVLLLIVWKFDMAATLGRFGLTHSCLVDGDFWLDKN